MIISQMSSGSPMKSVWFLDLHGIGRVGVDEDGYEGEGKSIHLHSHPPLYCKNDIAIVRWSRSKTIVKGDLKKEVGFQVIIITPKTGTTMSDFIRWEWTDQLHTFFRRVWRYETRKKNDRQASSINGPGIVDRICDTHHVPNTMVCSLEPCLELSGTVVCLKTFFELLVRRVDELGCNQTIEYNIDWKLFCLC